ncbi:MAG: retroviral-like aspartic protease family protein, partial [Thermoplasmata archaeon]|nr:retroviral-like aspartic protease family protein [Thermoplasmata archaeon]
TVAFVDTGADETVISKKIADALKLKLYGIYRSYSATDHIIEGNFAKVTLKMDSVKITMEVGVSDIPFQSDYSDEEGIEAILGLDFLQETGIKLDFSK